VVALANRDNTVLAVGEGARDMLGRTPDTISVIRPMKDGVIADYLITEAMLRYFISKVVGRFNFIKPEAMICIPVGATSVEQRAVKASGGAIKFAFKWEPSNALVFLTQPGPFTDLVHRPELAMLGRTYSSGFEADLDEWLLRRPRRTALNPAWPWGIWYPLRRTGAFSRLSPQEQGGVVREHAVLGRAYGEADLAHDIRLACHGLDVHDNDFVIGLVGGDLHPLSHLVQTMRRTVQTSQYLQSLGPFFVGHALWQSPAGRSV